MKRIALLLSLLLLVVIAGGCGKKSVSLNPGVVTNLAVLSLDGNLQGQTADQVVELKSVIRWMDRDLIKNLKKSGFNAALIKDKKDYQGDMGKLLIIDVEDFNAGNRAARAFVGFGAGAASLGLRYELLDETGTVVDQWQDSVGSSKGGTYCAQTLNRNALERVVNLLNK